jgi:competence ComEA-like helix-hairpin-helix protein
MDKIPLRTYLKEIEILVDRGENDQAIAHCRHILKTYPKNIATYRLLGKAFLEGRRYGDAADVFQRVLSGVPDDFVSHVGMSIIREDEGNQDAAIWHMERAFEIQPYNSAIQDELRRLYGRRDGLEPPKVRLTRGALARMYARGNLYQQAIGELRAALAEDPQRSDLQVMLARMYFMAGQKVEAVETCSSLLKKLPYCLEANRVISAILPETERKEETQVYRERVMALDPYLVLASPFETTADNVRDQVVVIEKLDYQEGQLEQASQPAWAASLGVSFDEFKSGEEPMPDWLQTISQGPAAEKKAEARPILEEQTSQEEPSSEASNLLLEEAQDEELPSWISFPDQPTGTGGEKAAEIPDWMKEAGWEASSGATESTLPPFDLPEEGEADLSEISKADLPPWLQALAPEGLDTSAAGSTEDTSQEFMPWLQEGASEGQPPALKAESDWLDELGEQPEGTPAEVPEWLGELGEAGQEPTRDEPTEEMPEWLKEPGGEPAKALTEAEEPGHAEQEVRLELPVSEGEQAEEMPEWLKETETEPAEQAVAEEEPAVAFETVEEVSLEEEISAEELPEWLAEIGAEPTEQAVAEEEPAIAFEVPEEASLEEESPAEETPEWLAEIEAEPAEQAVAEEEPAVAFEATEEASLEEESPSEETPEWLAEIGAESAEQAVAEEEPAVTFETPVGEEEEAGEIPSWLQELGVTPLEAGLGEHQVEDEDMASPFEEATRGEEYPDWMKGFDEEPAVAAFDEQEIEPDGLAASLEEAEPAEDIPSWIKELGTGQLKEMESAIDLSSTGADTGAIEEGEAEELDWLQIIGEKPMGAGPAFIMEEGTSTETSQDDYSPSDLEALLADTQPVRVDREDQVVPFNEILEEIDAGLQAETALEEAEDLAAQEASGTSLEEMEPSFEETLPEEVETIGEPIEALGTEADEQTLAESIEFSPEEGSALDTELDKIETPMVEDEVVLPQASAETVEQAASFDLEDQDASLAWLESLAAKHGVGEEELFTRPEERPADTPAWIEQELVEAGETFEQSVPVAEAEPGKPSEPGIEIEGPELEDAITKGDLEDVVTAGLMEASDFAPPEWTDETLIPEQAALEEELPEDKPAWLKALQAEDEEEVLTTQAEEIEPQLEASETEIEEVAQAELPEWLRAVQEEADQELAQRKIEQEIEASAALQDTDAAMAWLESLAAKQGVPEEELFTAPEQRTETPPEWIEETAQAEPDLSAQQAPIEDTPVEIAPVEEPLQASTVEELEVTEGWPESPVVEAEAEPGFEGDEPKDVQVETSGTEEPELPDWLAETEAEEIQEDEWSPPVEPVKAALRAPRHGTAPLSQPPAEPVNINKASLVELEVLPGVGFILAQNILTYRDAFGHYATIDDLIKVPGITSSILTEIREYLVVPAPEAEPTPVEPEMLAEAQSELIIARNRLAEGDVEETVAQYSKLINNRDLLPEIIRDLKEALYRFPVDISLWQTLGDAYMRSDQLTEALEAYTKAEELLR